MEKDLYILLIYKRLKGEISREEQQQLDTWLEADAANRNFSEQVISDWEKSQNYEPNIQLDARGDFSLLKERIRKDKETGAKVVSMNPRRLALRWVAAVAVLIVAGWVISTQIFSGSEMLIVQTGEGEKKELQLADGTTITLNQNSSLEYPKTFESNSRNVKFEGEGYFEVAKNSGAPFKVETALAEVKVLGTEFKVSAYLSDQSVTVIVDEGKVQLRPNGKEENLILTEGEKGIYDAKNKSLEESLNNDFNQLFFKTETMTFKNMAMKNVLEELKKNFETEIKLLNSDMENCPVTGRFPNADAKDILEYLATSFGMELVSVEVNSFELRGGSCQ